MRTLSMLYFGVILCVFYVILFQSHNVLSRAWSVTIDGFWFDDRISWTI
jgi:hypothetical protein